MIQCLSLHYVASAGEQRRQQPKDEEGGMEMVWYQCRESVAGYSTSFQTDG
jgi:hypothetical protein